MMRKMRHLIGTLGQDHVAPKQLSPTLSPNSRFDFESVLGVNLFCGGLEWLFLSEISQVGYWPNPLVLVQGWVGVEYGGLGGNDNGSQPSLCTHCVPHTVLCTGLGSLLINFKLLSATFSIIFGTSLDAFSFSK